MKRQWRAALGIGGIVLGTAVLGAVVFLYVSSRVGVFVIGGGVPLALVASVAVYARGVTTSTTGESDFVRQAARDAAESFREAVTTTDRLMTEYPRWDDDRVQTRGEQLAHDFADAGVDFDLSAATFTVDSPERVQQFDRLREDVDDYRDVRDESFREFARTEVQRLNDLAADISEEFLDGGGPMVTDATAVPGTGDYVDVEAVISTTEDDVRAVVKSALDRLERSVGEYDASGDASHRNAKKARERADEGDFDGAVSALRESAEAASGEVGGSFEADRKALERLLQTVDSTGVADRVSREYVETVEEVRETVTDLDSPLQATELNDAAATARQACIRMAAELEGDLAAHVDSIRAAEMPMGFYTAPPAVGTEYESTLAATETLTAFRQEWLAAVGDLMEAVETAERKAAVADSYVPVSERIGEELRRDGRAAAADLPVHDPEPFLELYAEQHDEAEYDPSGPAVTAPGGDETYALTVTARTEGSMGAKERLTVAVEGSGYDDERTTETFAAVEETFEDVPYGDVTVTATADPADFGDAEDSVHVDGDQTVELLLPERSLREQVCGAELDAVQSQLSTVGEVLAERFDEEEHLSTDQEFPIVDEYIPCLLVLWAEQEGHTARRDDGRVLVYDDDQFGSRLETIVNHNITDGDSMTFDEMRAKFLSVPASDELLADIVTDIDGSVTVRDGEVYA
ncbi:MAG: hypothetical protein ABEJ79_06485 [Halolamina sp.]